MSGDDIATVGLSRLWIKALDSSNPTVSYYISMANPPDPGVPAILLATAARLGYLVTSRDSSGAELGVLLDGGRTRHLYAVSAGSVGSVQWSFDGDQRLAPHVLSLETADVLRGGAANKDGTITFQDRRFAIRQVWNGAQMIAEAYSV